MSAHDVCSIFVYGTLRPDDDTGASWKHGFLDGTVQRKAILPNAALFFDSYPCVVLQMPGTSVVGYVVSCQRKSDFAAKLRLGDEIEDCPSIYERDVVEVRLVDEESTMKAFVYHRKACKRDTPIASGDWLDREGVSLNPGLYSMVLPVLKDK